MNNPFVPRVGGVLSADIAVPEHERELHFYARVLCTGEDPLWRDDLMNNRGLPVIGLGSRSAEHAELPLQWMPHIQVADVASSAERARSLGGSELMHGKDSAGTSQWAVLLDPNGAAFGIIPVVPAEAIPTIEGDAAARVGRITWLDLTVPDAAAARDFYRQVVGWSVQDVTHRMCAEDGTPAANIRHARDANPSLPPAWLIHLPVGDLAESLRRVEEGGGRILQATRGTDGEFASAVMQDPVGVCLALVPG